MGWRIVGATGAYTAQIVNLNTARDWAAAIATFKKDVTAPTVTINQAAAQSDPTSASPINFTVVFSERVTGFTTGDVTLSGTAGATTATVTEIAPNNGTTYNVAVSGMTAPGTVIATIGASVATDVAGNANAASTSTDNTVDFTIAQTTYALTIAENPAEGGTATDLTGTSPYAESTVVSIKAEAATNYHFVDWTAPAGTFDDANAAETTFTMPAQAVIVTANFAIDTYKP